MSGPLATGISASQISTFATLDHNHGVPINLFQGLPGLVGFWPMSSVQRSTGNVYDLSGQGRTLTYNGNPTFNIHNGKAPYVSLDGTGDFLSRADETDLDILGTETIYNSNARGLTLGGWYRFGSLGTAGMMSKSVATGNQRSYLLFMDSANQLSFQISTDGSTLSLYNSGIVPDVNTWYCITGFLDPGVEYGLVINGEKYSTTSSVPASIFNSTAALQVGAFNAGTSLMTGDVSLQFLLANYIGDVLMKRVYHLTKGLFT